MLLHDANGLVIRAHFQAGINGVVERNLFWDLASTFAPTSGYDSDANWLEFYVKPGLSFDYSLANGGTFYGKLTGVGSYTSGTDAYAEGNTGRITLEEGYLGYKTADLGGVRLDMSVGPRELKLGTGMLVANGASSGFERGALKLGPRKAWEMSAIGRIYSGGATGTVFYIDPNELPSSDNGNRLAGGDIRYDSSSGGYIGLTYLNVLESRTPYPQAAPGGIGPPSIIANGRDGTNAINFYARTNPFEGMYGNLFVNADFAYEWNDRIDLSAWAGRVQVGYAFNDLPWSPTLTYSYQTFSGDDPNTSRLERFDPLYYEGSPSAWATGSKSSMVFLNSNVQSHNIALRLQPTRRDSVTFRYAHIRANELNSPIQFGQGTRPGSIGGSSTVISGVTDAHLSDDFFLEYSRVINPNTYLTAGVSVAFPGAGIRNLPGHQPYWTGGFLNVVVNY
ncbi:hypothetical protein CSC94_19795 [Zhengella mangrovi]|uniref:Alginate export domain-containing protein n=1 Tax=Zhengella mangrovi TaxID=1982044 RepID=A0A2G1QIJ7_9HYPH|nr:alginate export family protein [Zhengella mangrovi]PHP65367.1 hypothetical protein CSC94_19795 [Zhengella mangrovi]